MRTYSDYVARLVGAMEEAGTLPLGGWPEPDLPPVKAGAPVMVLCSPHPDDELITGALSLRLRRAGWRVVNLAVTLGRDPARQHSRAQEMAAGCRQVGFEWRIAGGGVGLETVTLEAMHEDPEGWERMAGIVAAELTGLRPSAVLLPHAADGHPAHIGTHFLVMDALKHPAAAELGLIYLVETEYWHAMEKPNLMVESTPAEVADLLAALSHHVGEVRRNPYHLTLPLWMADNVRRGSERVGRHGAAAAPFRFATLYTLRRFAEGFVGMPLEPRRLAAADDPRGLFA